MKHSALLHILLGCSLSAATLTSCLQELDPTRYVTKEQMEASPTSLAGQNNAMAASMMNYGGSYSMAGYPAMMLWRDALCDQLPIYSDTYDYFNVPTRYMGDGGLYSDYWWQYYNTIHQANLLIGLIDSATSDPTSRRYLGNGLGYRAWAYLEAAQMWEFRRCGVATLDNYAEENHLWGLTVPIVTEKTTIDATRHNPRAPFHTMMRFINDDLCRAAEALQGYERSSVNEMSPVVIDALQARFWMLLASRFEQDETLLATQLSHEGDNDGYRPLAITTAADCYRRAAEAAQRAIDASGQPMTRDEWYNASTAFNTVHPSWIFGIMMNADDNKGEDWKNFVSFMSPDATFGVANATYEAMRLCDANLYSLIPTSDWRRDTWISPDDAGNSEAASRYPTILSGSDFALLPALTGLKFHPKAGAADSYKEGAAIDLPIIRVEEMYYILAEALAMTDGIAAGAAVLDNFTNTFRYTDGSFECPTDYIEHFLTALLQQKRIEFWGEGVVFWDYKRLRRGILRKYEGSNHPEAYQYNSPADVCARWLNIYLPSKEYNYNESIVRNPDPSYVEGMEY